MYIYGDTTVSYEFADERYNVVRTEINRHTISLTSMLKCNFKTKKMVCIAISSGIISRKNEIRRHEKVLDIDIVESYDKRWSRYDGITTKQIRMLQETHR